jgi:hypothetical protein
MALAACPARGPEPEQSAMVILPKTHRALPGKKTRPRRAAEGGGDKGVVETDSLFGQPIEARGLDEGMAHVAHGVPAVIVRKDEDNVGWAFSPSREPTRKRSGPG